MIKIKELHLKGFKDPNREVNIKFSDEPVTIIYGENGSGKTTLLKVIQAFFKQDISFLRKENIKEFKIFYNENNQEKSFVLTLSSDSSQNVTINDLDGYKAFINSSKSVLFGINRGAIGETNQNFLEYINKQLVYLRENQRFLFDNYQILERLIVETSNENSVEDFALTSNHSVVDDFNMQKIEKVLRKSFEKGQTAVLTGISNAFFSTIDNFLTTEYNNSIPPDFEERFKMKKSFFQFFVDKLDGSNSKDKLQRFIESNNPESIHHEKDLFKALVMNMLEKAEQDEKDNIDLKAINTLMNTFNEFVIHKKELRLNAVESSINFPNGQKHQLNELSSGERHLLSFLTIFLIIGRGRNFFLIDEPEISLSVKWQRRLLELLSEFSPDSQIIVATHSPAIANRNYKNQVELI